jgi:hypothetical protein
MCSAPERSTLSCMAKEKKPASNWSRRCDQLARMTCAESAEYPFATAAKSFSPDGANPSPTLIVFLFQPTTFFPSAGTAEPAATTATLRLLSSAADVRTLARSAYCGDRWGAESVRNSGPACAPSLLSARTRKSACSGSVSADDISGGLTPASTRTHRSRICWRNSCCREVSLSARAWVRADYLLRDEQSGALRTCIDAGLKEIYVGVERVDDADLELVQKELTGATITQALRRVSERYPEVFTVGSLIYGLPGDTPDAMRALFRLAHSLHLDEVFFIPLTPLPGTAYWQDELWDPTGDRFREFDFAPQARGNAHLLDLTRVISGCALFCWTKERRQRLWAGLFADDARRRSIVRRLAIRSIPVYARSWLTTGAKTTTRPFAPPGACEGRDGQRLVG